MIVSERPTEVVFFGDCPVETDARLIAVSQKIAIPVLEEMCCPFICTVLRSAVLHDRRVRRQLRIAAKKCIHSEVSMADIQVNRSVFRLCAGTEIDTSFV